MSTIPATIFLFPLVVTSTAQSTQYLTLVDTTTVTTYTGTSVITSTVVVPETVTVGMPTPTTTVQTTEVLTSTGSTTVTEYTTTTSTSYTATTSSTSTAVVYTTVTSLAGAAVSNPSAYLGFISLFAVTIGHRTITGKTRRIRHAFSRHAPSRASLAHSLSPHLAGHRDTLLSRLESLMEGRWSSN
jgi:hypothetical protein